MEAVPVMRQKFVDLTATAGMGLLNEMSIAEVRFYLSLLWLFGEVPFFFGRGSFGG